MVFSILCYCDDLPADEIPEIPATTEEQPEETTPDPTQIFDQELLQQIPVLTNEKPAEETIQNPLPVEEPAQSDPDPAPDQQTTVNSSPAEEPNEENKNETKDISSELRDLLNMSSYSIENTNSQNKILIFISENMISNNEAEHEQIILLQGIKEQLSKDSERDTEYQKEVKQLIFSIARSLSVDLIQTVSLDEIKISVSVDSVSGNVSGNESISANRLYFDGNPDHSISAMSLSGLSVSVSNISGNIAASDIEAGTNYLRNIFYVLIVIAVFLAMISAMMIEQLIFRRIHG